MPRVKIPGKQVTVSELPNCDFCQQEYNLEKKAEYDGRTRLGPWANMCKSHFAQYGEGLGMGKGQKLILAK